MRILTTAAFITIFIFAYSQNNIAVINAKELQERLTLENDTIYVINFWATWCPPCMSEMPIFMEFGVLNKDVKMKMLLISFDYTDKINERIIPFIENFDITEEVVVFDTPPGVEWMEYVYPNYTGSIPATLIYKNNKHVFHDGEITSYKQLDSLFLSIYSYD